MTTPLLKRLAAAAMVTLASGAHAQSPSPVTREPLMVYAAGSLRAALTALARALEGQAPVEVKLTFGPSGILKERIEGGEPAQVFASANICEKQLVCLGVGSLCAQRQDPGATPAGSRCSRGHFHTQGRPGR